jgi:ABC-type antimicrobial peptide transport system permease subunit
MPSFSRNKLLLRNLRYFRAANFAVVAGMIVATAVLTGALMVGDSVRGSLRDLAEHRLDFVDHAMASPRFIDQSFATRLAADPGFKERFVSITPGITLKGGAAPGNGKARVAGVQISALADRYPVSRGQAILNPNLAAAIGHAAVRFSVPAPDEAPRDSALARRSRADTITTFNVDKSEVARPGGFLDLFNLTGGQRQTPAAWLNLKDLQDALDRADQVNLFLVAAKPSHSTPEDAASLNQLISQIATLADYGLETESSADKSQTVIASKSTYIHPAIAKAAEKLASEKNVPLQQVSVYLINNIVKEEPNNGAPTVPSKALHYALAAGINDLGSGGEKLAPDEIAVNQWTADQMGLKVGDKLRLDYYLRQSNGDLSEVRSDRPGVGLIFKVAKILPMKGLGADQSLTPTYKGLTDADSIADWRPPLGLTIDKKLVTKADEKYWSEYKAAPKICVSLATAEKLWGNTYGDITSLRIPAGADTFAAELVKRIDPAALGMVFRPVKDQQLQAASGSTDFAGLFIGFSFFLLIAAVMLVAMLFRLSVEQRSRQLGLLSACGFAPRRLRNLCLEEGLLLAVVGGILGCALAVAYTALIVYGLRTWWIGAIGTTALRLHVVPETLIYGFVGSVIVALIAIWWAVRKVSKSSPAGLLAGALGSSAVRLAKRPKLSLIIGVICLLAAIALFGGGAIKKIDSTGAFLGGGSALLVACLCFAYVRLRPTDHPTARVSLASLALRNATRNRTRSLLCVALIALASFTLVTVSSMQSSTPEDTFDKKSGSGGYALIVQTDIPLLGDLNTLEGRRLLMREPSAKNPEWQKAQFAMMRSWAGQDISCLNVTQPSTPTILAVPKTMTQGDRFTFASTVKDVPNPWDLLTQPQDDPNTIPVIADAESAQYILKLNLGDSLPLTDAAGRPRKLKLVATLSGSIFQSEMLMGEENFLKLFPAQSGYTTVLAQTAPADLQPVENLLRETLNDPNDQEQSDYSASIQTTASRLAAYNEIANTYLSTFQVLGSLGLMLGTIGLAVVLVRNLIERRPELALLGALGFAPSRRSKLVFWENVSLLVLGLLIGAGSALAGVIPNVMTSPHHINTQSLAIALALVLVVGLISLLIAVKLTTRRITPAALRAE